MVTDCLIGQGFLFGEIKMLWHKISVIIVQHHKYVKNPQLSTLTKMVKFLKLCKFYLKNFLKNLFFAGTWRKKKKTGYYSKTTMVHIANYMDHRYHILEFSLKEIEMGHWWKIVSHAMAHAESHFKYH